MGLKNFLMVLIAISFFVAFVGAAICDNDDVCEPPNEDYLGCTGDCGQIPFCGNGQCTIPEYYGNCPEDCGYTPVCGDGYCHDSEKDMGNCYDDCFTYPANSCGDNVVDFPFESCDDGFSCNDDSSCNPLELSACGNDPDQCITRSGDGCSGKENPLGACQIEEFECTGGGSSPCCGDGIINGTDDCDWGNWFNSDEPNFCRTDCSFPVCGDALLDSSISGVFPLAVPPLENEQCDDGSKCANGDLCTFDFDCVGVAGDELCLPRSGEQCDAFCKAQFSVLRIVSIDAVPGVLGVNGDFASLDAVLESTEVGSFADFNVVVKNADTGEILFENSEADFHRLVLGRQTVDFSQLLSGLEFSVPGTFRLQLEVQTFVNHVFQDSKTVFLTVSIAPPPSGAGEGSLGLDSSVVVPEFDLFLMPVLLLVVLGLLLKK